MSRRDDEDRIRRFLEPGTEIAGNLTGAGLVALLGGPLGVVAGVVSATATIQALRQTLGEAMQRQLGEREQTRVSAALMLAAEEIRQRLDRGEQPRQDGFFTPRDEHRPDAEEVAEGVIRAVQREHEERKAPYLTHLIATVYFDATISRADANALLHQADALTYRQMVLLALVDRYEQRHEESRVRVGKRGVWWDMRQGTDPSDTAQMALDELMDLERLGHIDVAPSGEVSDGTALGLTGGGEQLVTRLELERIDHRELDELDRLIHLD